VQCKSVMAGPSQGQSVYFRIGRGSVIDWAGGHFITAVGELPRKDRSSLRVDRYRNCLLQLRRLHTKHAAPATQPRCTPAQTITRVWLRRSLRSRPSFAPPRGPEPRPTPLPSPLDLGPLRRLGLRQRRLLGVLRVGPRPQRPGEYSTASAASASALFFSASPSSCVDGGRCSQPSRLPA